MPPLSTGAIVARALRACSAVGLLLLLLLLLPPAVGLLATPRTSRPRSVATRCEGSSPRLCRQLVCPCPRRVLKAAAPDMLVEIFLILCMEGPAMGAVTGE